MSKRFASEALEDDIGSPASKRFRSEAPSDSGTPTTTTENGAAIHSRPATTATARFAPHTDNGAVSSSDEDEEDDEDEDEAMEDAPPTAPISNSAAAARLRQSAPTAGYDDLYLDTIDRNVLDFDFEKLCSVSLSNINVYACLVCGRYYQGRGPQSHAYFHALEENHHVFINMETHKIYVLPEGYEVKSRSLDDIKYVSDPQYTREEVAALDRKSVPAWSLAKKEYVPGFVGMNNIKENDYLNVIVQALSHVGPLRNFFLLEDFFSPGAGPSTGKDKAGGGGPGKKKQEYSELVRRTATLFRKIWNPRAFKNHVSPHELLQEIALRSNKRFTLTHQSDPVDFLSWYLNNLHLGLGGSKTPTRAHTSMIHSIFQGRLQVESQAITTRSTTTNPTSTNTSLSDTRLLFEPANEVKVETHPFLLLTLDLPPAPLFQDDQEKNIIPQIPLRELLAKYNGIHAQEHLTQRKRYRLLHPLPPFLFIHIKRFSKSKFLSHERNPTIVTFDPRNLDVSDFVQPNPEIHPPGEPVWYDMVANVVHESVVRAKEDVGDSGEEGKMWKVQVLEKGGGAKGDGGRWVVCQDLFVEGKERELLYLGESYLQVWERRGGYGHPAGGKGKGKGKGKGRV